MSNVGVDGRMRQQSRVHAASLCSCLCFYREACRYSCADTSREHSSADTFFPDAANNAEPNACADTTHNNNNNDNNNATPNAKPNADQLRCFRLGRLDTVQRALRDRI